MTTEKHEPRKVEDGPGKVSRRDVVAAGVGMAGAVLSSALAPSQALAADGEIVTVGSHRYTSTDAFTVIQSGTSPWNTWAKLCGNDAGYPRCGVSGVADEESGVGVEGSSSGGTGVHGLSASDVYAGVYGENYAGVGVRGQGPGGGVVGTSTAATAPGVQAKNTAGGLALHATGKTKFDRSGTMTTVIGQSYKTVTVSSGLTTNSKFLVTMQGSPGAGVYVTYAKYYSSTQFRVYFNTTCKAAVKLAWMVID